MPTPPTHTWQHLVTLAEGPGPWLTKQVRAGWRLEYITPTGDGFWFYLTKD